jgi:hypothetical protein
MLMPSRQPVAIPDWLQQLRPAPNPGTEFLHQDPMYQASVARRRALMEAPVPAIHPGPEMTMHAGVGLEHIHPGIGLEAILRGIGIANLHRGPGIEAINRGLGLLLSSSRSFAEGWRVARSLTSLLATAEQRYNSPSWGRHAQGWAANARWGRKKHCSELALYLRDCQSKGGRLLRTSFDAHSLDGFPESWIADTLWVTMFEQPAHSVGSDGSGAASAGPPPNSAMVGSAGSVFRILLVVAGSLALTAHLFLLNRAKRRLGLWWSAISIQSEPQVDCPLLFRASNSREGKIMRKFAVIVLGVVMLSAALSGIASAQQYPSVSSLTAFSASTNYMSQAGYLRYLVHQQTGQWLTYQEAGRIVKQQRGQ